MQAEGGQGPGPAAAAGSGGWGSASLGEAKTASERHEFTTRLRRPGAAIRGHPLILLRGGAQFKRRVLSDARWAWTQPAHRAGWKRVGLPLRTGRGRDCRSELRVPGAWPDWQLWRSVPRRDRV